MYQVLALELLAGLVKESELQYKNLLNRDRWYSFVNQWLSITRGFVG